MRVPDPYIEPLSAIGTLEPTDFRLLLQAVEKEADTLTPAIAVASISEAISLDESEAKSIMAALTSVTSLARANGWTADQTATMVAESEDILTDDIDELQQRLSSLLAAPTIRLLGKAFDMATEHDKVFLDCRVLTDLRPIFSDDLHDQPAGAVLTHSLKLEYLHDGGHVGNTYITLDDFDVAKLLEALNRAEGKANTMKQMMRDNGIAYLGPSDQ